MTRQTRAVEVEYVGVDEAEVMSGRSRWSWRKDAYSGRIASAKVGRRLLIPVAEIRRVLAEGTRPRVGDPVQSQSVTRRKSSAAGRGR